MQSATRYLETFPDTPGNKEWGQAYLKRWNERPTNWSWQNATAVMLLSEAVKKANSTDGKKVAEALTGLTIKCPFGADGTVTATLPGTATPSTLGQLQLASFANPGGLDPKGGNIYAETAASGSPSAAAPLRPPARA